MWRQSAVNLSFFLSLAAFRTRSRPCNAPSRFGVRSAPPCSAFPSVPALGSTASATDRSALFGGFTATMAECNSSPPFIAGYGSSPSRRGPARRRGRPAGHEVSRFPEYRELMHMPGSATTPDQTGARDDAPVCFAFRGVNGVGVRIKCLSRLNGWPMRAPTDASGRPSRTNPHGSGSMRFATPSS